MHKLLMKLFENENFVYFIAYSICLLKSVRQAKLTKSDFFSALSQNTQADDARYNLYHHICVCKYSFNKKKRVKSLTCFISNIYYYSIFLQMYISIKNKRQFRLN